MHKIKICFAACVILISSAFCFLKLIELCDLKNQKKKLLEQENSIKKFCTDIKKSHISFEKSKNQIFGNNLDIKNTIKEISENIRIHNTLLKINNKPTSYGKEENIKIKLCAKQESQIYKFIEELHLKLFGIIKFERIRITKNNDGKLEAKFQIKIFSFNKNPFQESISINPSRPKLTPINLFGTQETHKLTCAICGEKAFVDNMWLNVGDKIDGYKITNIFQNAIEVQHCGKKARVTLGSSW